MNKIDLARHEYGIEDTILNELLFFNIDFVDKSRLVKYNYKAFVERLCPRRVTRV